MNNKLNVAIAGATGAVGTELIKLLEVRNFPIKELRLLASEKSIGKKVKFQNNQYKIKQLTKDSFSNIDVVFFSAGASQSKEYVKPAIKAGALVIDNSSAYRMEKTIPLIVPECNFNHIKTSDKLVANPNCSTIQLVMAINPLHKINPIKEIRVATYQAVSGSGVAAIEELNNQMYQSVNKEELKFEVYPAPILTNLIPHIDIFTDNHYTKEEMKMVNETKKILDDDKIKISATCVRVPVYRSHSESVWVKFTKNFPIKEVENVLSKSPGIKVINKDENGGYPMPYYASNTNDTYVGRIRKDLADDNSICFWCVSDQLRKGAALNAIQIAEKYFKVN